jgi:hypothetical protein
MPLSTSSRLRDDLYLEVDHGWGGAIVLDVHSNEVLENGFTRVRGEDNSHLVGSLVGTFTLRFPISCSRCAPCIWAGGRGIFGGGRSHDFFLGLLLLALPVGGR